MRPRALSLLAACLLLAPASAQVEIGGDFESTPIGPPPAPWFVPMPESTDAKVVAIDGGQALQVSCTSVGSQSYANAMLATEAAAFQGKAVAYSARVRFEARAANPSASAHLWLRVDRPNAQVGFFDNMMDRPIRSGEWATYTIVGDVAPDAMALSLGVLLMGGGTAWIDDITITPAAAIDLPPAVLTDWQVANLEAFARIYGVVRWFHPSDEAEKADWNAIAVRGARHVENAAGPEDLRDRLLEIFAPVAPTLEVTTQPFINAPEAVAAPGATSFRTWRHDGLGSGNVQVQIYKSQRLTLSLDNPDPAYSAVGDCWTSSLPGGAWCRVPLALPIIDGATYPAATATPPDLGLPDGWRASVSDRSSRVAAAIVAWNLFQHFYPYFDVVEVDWPAALPIAIRETAAADSDDAVAALQRLTAKAQDGHVWIGDPRRRPFTIPLGCEWIGDRLVVVATAEDSPATPGDAIIAIEGLGIDEIYAVESTRISAATEGWRRHRAISEILTRRTADPVSLELEDPAGARRIVSITPVALMPGVLPEPERPANGSEIAPGVVYFDLNGTTAVQLQEAMPALAAAEGIVFDLRGYPADAGYMVLGHLATHVINSAHWNIPLITRPDRQALKFTPSQRWVIPPMQPHLPKEGGRVAFITDGRAISYAESCMGIIEAYELGDIVGATTAGTNGNVQSLTLPGGLTVSFTGMQVIKHDGSTHHGVGIAPTVPAVRTQAGVAAGRDELLDKAIEVVTRPR